MGTETISPRYRDIDDWQPSDVLDTLIEGQLAAVAAVRAASRQIEAAAMAAVPCLKRGGRLVYIGAGTSGRIGIQDGVELVPTFDWPRDRLVLIMAGGEPALLRSVENAEDDRTAACAALAEHGIGADDCVIALAASGSTPYTVAAVEDARRRGALTIGIANNPDTPLLAAAQFPILLDTGAEAIAGSTRMKAGTAQKVVLTVMSTLIMIRLGRVYQGMMVDVQALNEKLRRRCERMLYLLTGREDGDIAAALKSAHGKVKLAMLVLEGLTVAAAEDLLARHGGHLRPALTELRTASYTGNHMGRPR